MAELLTSPSLAILGLPGGGEWIILLILGLLLFGRRLPEVGRSIGRSIVEFKKGIKGVEDEIEAASSSRKDQPQITEQRSQDMPQSTADQKEPADAADEGNPYARSTERGV